MSGGRSALAIGLVALAVSSALVLTSGCAGRRNDEVDFAELRSAESLYREAMALIESGKLRKAKLALERMQFDPETSEAYEPLVRLGIADATYHQNDILSLISAHSLYLDFVTLFGDHPRAPYAQLQAAMCSLRQVNAPSRDQAQTIVAINEFREILSRYPDSPYANVAREKIREAEERLARSEYLIARFYLKKKQWVAGIDRLRDILRNYPYYTETDEVLWALGRASRRAGDPVQGRLYLEQLVDAFPDSERVDDAKELLTADGSIEAEPGG